MTTTDTTPATALPDAVHEYAEWITQAAYAMGYQAALHDIATRQAELDAAWRPIGRRSYEEQVAARIAVMEADAERFRATIEQRSRGNRKVA